MSSKTETLVLPQRQAGTFLKLWKMDYTTDSANVVHGKADAWLVLYVELSRRCLDSNLHLESEIVPLDTTWTDLDSLKQLV